VRVFLDTNVLVSAFAARGLCADLLEVILLEHDLVLGRNVLRELQRALRSKLKLASARATEIVTFVSGEAIEIVEDSAPSGAEVDPDDSIVLGEAIAARADVFVTGDAAVLKLTAIGELRIVAPRQFWELLQSNRR